MAPQIGEEVAKDAKRMRKGALGAHQRKKLQMIKTFGQQKGKGRQKVHKNPAARKENTRAFWPRKSDKSRKSQFSSILRITIPDHQDVAKTLPTTGPPKRIQNYVSRNKKPGTFYSQHTFEAWIPQLKRNPKSQWVKLFPQAPGKAVILFTARSEVPSSCQSQWNQLR